jgi:hypothetical protein
MRWRKQNWFAKKAEAGKINLKSNRNVFDCSSFGITAKCKIYFFSNSEETMDARNEGQKSLIKSIEQALSVDATNTQISVNAQLISGIAELLINKGLLSKEEILTMSEAKKEILVSRYTNNKQRFEMIDGLDIYESMLFEINTAFNHFKEKIEAL